MTGPVPDKWVRMAYNAVITYSQEHSDEPFGPRDMAAALTPVLADLAEQMQALESREVTWAGSYKSNKVVLLDDVLTLLEGE
jgi:hypothetical protein